MFIDTLYYFKWVKGYFLQTNLEEISVQLQPLQFDVIIHVVLITLATEQYIYIFFSFSN